MSTLITNKKFREGVNVQVAFLAAFKNTSSSSYPISNTLFSESSASHGIGTKAFNFLRKLRIKRYLKEFARLSNLIARRLLCPIVIKIRFHLIGEFEARLDSIERHNTAISVALKELQNSNQALSAKLKRIEQHNSDTAVMLSAIAQKLQELQSANPPKRD